MLGVTVDLKFVRTNDSLPFYFDEADILKLLASIDNMKHLAMLKVLFCGCLRSGELCTRDIFENYPLSLNLTT